MQRRSTRRGNLLDRPETRPDTPHDAQDGVLPEDDIEPGVQDLVTASHPDNFKVKDTISITSELHQKDVDLVKTNRKKVLNVMTVASAQTE